MKIAILGDGGWGTTLGILLSKKGYKVVIWGPFPKYLKVLDKKRENEKYLPKIKIPKEIEFEDNIKKATRGAKVIIVAIPSKFFRKVVKKLKNQIKKDQILVSVAKGIEKKTHKRMSEILEEELGKVKIGVLSGPNIAREIALGMPAVSLVASKNKKVAQFLQDVFFAKNFRVYLSNDILGVEIGGAFKNIIAIACGIADGLGFKDNTKAAICVRGLVEMERLVKKLGGKRKTVYGIAGLGDLIVTSFSPLSRNRTLGEKIGQGKSLKEAINEIARGKGSVIRGVVEGVETIQAIYQISKKLKIDMPITKAVWQILFQKKSPKEILEKLMQRPKKAE
jgi:glycerol-3-phosphate dehydrogenase (NAD(P)+)